MTYGLDRGRPVAVLPQDIALAVAVEVAERTSLATGCVRRRQLFCAPPSNLKIIAKFVALRIPEKLFGLPRRTPRHLTDRPFAVPTPAQAQRGKANAISLERFARVGHEMGGQDTTRPCAGWSARMLPPASRGPVGDLKAERVRFAAR